jgi:hypothetical protein
MRLLARLPRKFRESQKTRDEKTEDKIIYFVLRFYVRPSCLQIFTGSRQTIYVLFHHSGVLRIDVTPLNYMLIEHGDSDEKEV